MQHMAHLMNHGAVSEALTAAVTSWQSILLSGNIDDFFVGVVKALKDDPAGIAIISALLLSLGYSLTMAIPTLQHEMGAVPYLNYAALGAKGGAAVYDVVSNPGSDWFFGTAKWLVKIAVNIAKITIAPFVEAYYYGFRGGFLHGWVKSAQLSGHLAKEISAAVLDLLLSLCTIPILEVSTFFIYMPFRGITNFFSAVLSTFAHISDIGTALLSIANRPIKTPFLASFKPSSLYGFDLAFQHYVSNPWLNYPLNVLRFIVLIPWQTVKNFIILPPLDLLSLQARIALTVADGMLRLFCHATGVTLFHFGKLSDNSLGIFLAFMARGITMVSNKINNQASTMKHYLLAKIHIQRNTLYHWAFPSLEEQPKRLSSAGYYSKQQRRWQIIEQERTEQGPPQCAVHPLEVENHRNPIVP